MSYPKLNWSENDKDMNSRLVYNFLNWLSSEISEGTVKQDIQNNSDAIDELLLMMTPSDEELEDIPESEVE